MATSKKGGAPGEGEQTLSKLAENVLASCREALIAAGDLSSNQVDRLRALSTGPKKPKAADLQAILEEEGELT